MARIFPFAALRYNEELSREIGTLCCPPYDVISPGQQAGLEAENPYNIVRLERPLGEDRYRRAGALLRSWREDGILKRDGAPAYYVYRLGFADGGLSRGVYGFFARVGLEPFDRGIILPHEETLSKDMTDRYALLSETLCNISPIYSLYEDPGGFPNQTILAAMGGAPPHLSFTDGDGVTHSLWRLTDPESLAALAGSLAGARILIADGHHRYETALAFYEDQKRKNAALPADSPLGTALMFLVDTRHPDLVVWPTHRLVHNLPNFSAGDLVQSLSASFAMTSCPADGRVPALLADKPHTVGLYDGGDTVTLLTQNDPGAVSGRLPGKSEAYCSLEVSLLHACILEPHLGIDKEKLAAKTHLAYTRDLEEAYAKVQGGDYQCAFLLPPTPVSMIGRVADHGERMPQKATYFYPKLTTGLVIHPLDS